MRKLQIFSLQPPRLLGSVDLADVSAEAMHFIEANDIRENPRWNAGILDGLYRVEWELFILWMGNHRM